mgnify:CR=1 FL=1
MKNKFGFKRLLILGLCNLTSGIFFGAGCLVAEHIDSWGYGEANSTESTTRTSLQK